MNTFLVFLVVCSVTELLFLAVRDAFALQHLLSTLAIVSFFLVFIFNCIFCFMLKSLPFYKCYLNNVDLTESRVQSQQHGATQNSLSNY